MTENGDGVVIVGAGAAGSACAKALLAGGFEGGILLVDGEPGGFGINRTLVDTGLLPGLLGHEQIALPRPGGIEVVSGRAVGWGEGMRSVVLEDGRKAGAGAVVLACGSVPRGLGEGVRVDAEAPVHVLHEAADAERLRAALPDPAGAGVIVIGAGFIGAEVASHYAAAGARVTLVGRSRLPLVASFGDGIANALADLHRERVDARFGVEVRAVRATGESGGSGVAVELSDGSVLHGDVAIVAVGTRPEATWAGFGGAIPTDGRLRVRGRGCIGGADSGVPGVDAPGPDAPHLYAAGGVAEIATEAGPIRIDHWEDSAAQGAHAAMTLLHDLGLGEDPGPYTPVAGFTLMVHGAVAAARGVRLAGGGEECREVDGGLLAEFSREDGSLAGVAGWNAGAHVSSAAARLWVGSPARDRAARPGG